MDAWPPWSLSLARGPGLTRGLTVLCLLAACSIHLLLPSDWQRVIGRRRLETRCEHLVRFVGVPMGEQTIRLLTWSP